MKRNHCLPGAGARATRMLRGIGRVLLGGIVVTGIFAADVSSSTSNSGAAPLEAARGEDLTGSVPWNAGVVAAPNGLLIDGRAATPGLLSTPQAKAAQTAKTLINPRSLSGLWFDPAQDGHGFNFTFVEREGANDIFAVTWYVYRNGAQVWMAGSGEVVGNAASAQVVLTSGAQFPPAFNPAAVNRQAWGTISIEVESCSRIRVSWQPVVSGFSAGSLTAQPIVVAGGSPCQVTNPPPSGDDHGNSCPSATTVAVPGSIGGAISPASDADFFRVNLGGATTLTVTSTSASSLDPLAVLFDSNCVAIASDDDGGGGLQFRLQRALSAGTYFVGVGSFAGATSGSYQLTFSTTSAPPPPPSGNTATVAVTNQLIYPIIVRANGNTLGQVAAGGTASQTISVGSSLTVTFELVRPTLSGTPLGNEMAGTFQTMSITAPTNSFTYTVDNVIGTTPYFAPRVNNNTNVPLLMGVNMGLSSENRCNCVAPAFQQNTVFGYYRLFSNSNVRGYRTGSNYSGPFIFWNVSTAEVGTGIVRLTANIAP